jgi:hypothetical protein
MKSIRFLFLPAVTFLAKWSPCEGFSLQPRCCKEVTIAHRMDPRAAGRSGGGLSKSLCPAKETCLRNKQSDDGDTNNSKNKNNDRDAEGKSYVKETPASSTRSRLPANAKKKHEPARDTSSEGNAQKIMGKVFLGLSLSFSYSITVLGVLLTFGLLLNIFGYGYQITPERELRIDTISRLREESQFRQEVVKSMKESRQEQEQGNTVVRLRELTGPPEPTK